MIHRSLLLSLLMIPWLAGCDSTPRTASEAASAPRVSAGLPLFDTFGDLHRDVASRVPAAQRYFDQGLRILFREALDLAEAEAQATEAYLDRVAVLQGPLAEAEREHAKRVQELHALAAQSPLAAAGLNDALELEAKRHKEVADAIEASQNPLKLLLEDMRFELDLIGKTNAERAVMVELRRQNIDAMSAEGQAALETVKAFDAEAKAKEAAQ